MAANDLWLKSSLQVGTFPTPPNNQQIAELLAKAPWTGFTGNEQAFHWELIDRPEAGTAFLAFVNPPTRPPPSDGLRFLAASPTEQISTSVHSVQCPTTVANPTALSTITVELTCLSALHGHFGPQSRNSGFLPDSPELKLTRYRRRYHLSRGGASPALSFFYYGRDDSGGAGQGEAPTAPDGWEKTPVRSYPLAKDLPTEPIYIYPSKTRAASAMGALPGAVAGAIPGQMGQAGQMQQGQMQQGMNGMGGMMGGMPGVGGQGGAMRPPGPPQQPPHFAQGAGQPGQFPSGQSPYQRQQQLAAMANASMMQPGAGGIDPRQYQQQMLAQQQAAMAYQAAHGGAGAMGGGMMGGMAGMGGPQNPGGVNPAAYNQLAQYQAAQAQQQQQQAHLAAQQQQQQQQAALMAAQQKARAAAAARPKPSLPPQAVPVPPPSASHDEDQSPNADILDVLTARQLAIHRFAKNHELFAPLVDPWKVEDILAGKKRKREIEDQVKAGRSVTSGGVAGLGKMTELSELASQAIRFPEGTGTKAGPAADAEVPKKLSLAERKARLLKLQAEAEKEVEELKKRFEEQTAASRSRQEAVVQA